MGTQINKRELFSKHALSAGLGVGALALLPQRASADTPFTSFPFTATGAPTPRTMPDRLGEIKNVKDFGATGDGNTDDTAAVQSCFDAAFGTWTSPHGSTNRNQNVPVYFPPGTYMVKPTVATKTITGIANDGSGLCRVAIAGGTSGLVNGDVVYIRGVVGTTEANGSWIIKDVDSTHITLSTGPFVHAWTSGGTVRPPALRIQNVMGGWIYGAGRFASNIEMINPDGRYAALISTNGMGFTKIENMSFSAPDGCIAFDAMWDGQGSSSCQSNTWQNCQLGGTGSAACDYGLAIGHGDYMGSESTILNCYVSGCDISGISARNQNALQNSVIGGNIASCSIGIEGAGGSFPNINGVGFQNYQRTPHVDIAINGGSEIDCYNITGCRTESHNFLSTPGGVALNFYVSAISQSGDTGGYFIQGSGRFVVDCCYSLLGWIDGRHASMTINHSNFARGADYLQGHSENYTYLEVNPTRIVTYTGTTYTIASYDGGAKLVFTNASPITVTLAKNSDNTVALNQGTFIYVQQGGAGKVTFQGASGVTLTSRGSLKSLNGQYACGKLTCVGSDAWILEGDIVA